MGGLPKKATRFATIAAQKKLPLLKVDGGGLLFDRLPPAPHELEQKKITAAGIVNAYNRIGYAAVGVASLDLAAGLDFLLKLQKESRFAWLSANLFDRETGKTFFRPYLSVSVGGARVAVVGLTGLNNRTVGLLPARAELKPWSEVLPALLAEVAPRHDFIILLTDLPASECLDISRQQPRIALIVNASGESRNQARLLTDSTILAATDKRGRYLGGLEIFWNAAGKWSTGENYYTQLQGKEADLERARLQIDQLGSSPETVSRVGNVQRRAGMLQLEIGELKNKLLGTPASYFINNFYAMVPEVADDPGVLAVVDETRKAISTLGGVRAARAAGRESYRPPDFTGVATCSSCHSQIAVKWRTTAHARAYDTLVGKNRQFDFDCLPCHVTGINQANGVQVLALAPEFRGVGCEACHGPGRRHVEEPALRFAPVDREVCLNCHVEEHDDHFDFAADLKKIKCNR